MIARVITGCVHSWSAPLAAVLVLVSFSVLAQEKMANAIAGLKAVNSGQNYEIKVTSEQPFLRSDLPVLRLGNQEITISRAPDDGGSYERIFILTLEQFQNARSGDKVAFQWGRGEGKPQVELGSLDKTKLEK